MTMLNHVDRDGDELRVSASYTPANGAYVRSVSSTDDVVGVYVPKDAAPEVALAILEAAGWKRTDGDVGQAIENLDSHVHPDEDEQIDAEALRMLNAAFTSQGMTPVTALPEQIATFWRAAAYEARKLHS